MTAFDEATAVAPVEPGAFRARIGAMWWTAKGANGGMVAAVALRAMGATVTDRDRPPRSLTIHLTSPALDEPLDVECRQERSGRSLTTVSARLTQGGRLVALALAAFGAARPDGMELADPGFGPPAAPPPDAVPTWSPPAAHPFLAMYDLRPALGALPFAGADRAESGGWIRLREAQLADAHVVCALIDAWVPAVYARLSERTGVPTIDLTVHFRAPWLPRPGASPGDWSLVRVHSALAHGGYVEEDGEVWSADGALLAQSRQLSMLMA